MYRKFKLHEINVLQVETAVNKCTASWNCRKKMYCKFKLQKINVLQVETAVSKYTESRKCRK